MKIFRNYFVIFVLTIAFTTVVDAQRPKIGLTLSGGGAKGLAHVGILQAIDSAGLKIDYITGTSIGAIAGAMYATGYSGNDIDSIARLFNWNELLARKPKYSEVGISEKDEFKQYSMEIPLEGFKPKMGNGLIEPEEIWLLLSELFFHVYDQKDFSKFDIPFKCIATDLTSGEAVVIDSGEIVKAIRSSMAIPSVLSAVQYDSTHYVDGGIVRNFPVSDVLEMGADYVIGVNLYSGLEKSKNLNSALDVMYQITNYRDAKDLVEQKKICNILIEPPVQDFSSGSFGDADELFDIGREMRDKYYPYFKRLADSLNNIAKTNYKPQNRFIAKKEVIIDSYEIFGLNKVHENIIIKKLNLEEKKTFTSEELTEAFRQLYSNLYFKYVYYELEATTSGHANIIIRVQELPLSAFKLGFSFHSFTTPALILNYTGRDIVFTNSRTMAKLALSQDLKGILEYKQYYGKRTANSIGMRLKYIEQKINSYDGDEIKAQYKTGNALAEIDYNYYPSKRSILSAAFSYQYSGFSPNISSTLRFEGHSSGFNAGVEYKFNTINRSFLPTKGVDILLSGKMQFHRKFDAVYVGHDSIDSKDSIYNIKPHDPLYTIRFISNWYIPLGAKTTLINKIQVARVFSDTNFYLDNNLIGGNERLYINQFSFVGYQDGQLPATSLLTAQLGIQYKVWGELYLSAKANVGIYNFYTANGLIDDISNQFISGFNASIAYNLSMLPFELSINYSPEVNAFFSHVRLGFIF